MTDYTDYFLNSSSDIVQLELLEISHSSFSQTYYIVRNYVNGVTVTLEDMSSQEFEYYPLRITPLGSSSDLDQSIKIELGDLGEIIPSEIDAINDAQNWAEKPILKYRTYRSDDLTAPLLGPYIFEIQDFTFNREGVIFEAKAPSLNINRTGELYKFERFPMLRGFL